MANDLLDRLEALAGAATPGPRHAERFFRAGDTPDTPGRYRIFLLGASNPETNSRDCDWTFADAHFIAALDRETVLKLIAVAKAAAACTGGDFRRDPNCTAEWNALVDTLSALQERKP